MTCVLHTARISDIESTACGNEERKMVNDKLGKKLERGSIKFATSEGQTAKKSESRVSSTLS